MKDEIVFYLAASAIASLILAIVMVDLFLIIKVKNLKVQQEKERFNFKIKSLMQEHEKEMLDSASDAKESERVRIGQELHDSLGGILNSVKLQFESMKSQVSKLELQNQEFFDITSEKITEAAEEVRRISQDLHYANVAKFGLETALNDLVAEINKLDLVKVSIDAFNLDGKLHYEVEINVYRIFQELLTNTLKYANATTAEIQLVYSLNEVLNITYSDDGEGFLQEKMAQKKDTGLKGIEIRLQKIGCSEFHISGEHGMDFSASIPLTPVARF
jgi:signal transduction histidine kinase